MGTVADLITYAQAELGKPYVYGDEGPNTFDCSGLMQWVFGEAGIRLPRTAAQQQKSTSTVATPLPGDLVFYGNPAHHVALYVGDGKQIAAPHTGAVVQLQKVSSGATYGRVSGAGAVAGAVFDPVLNPLDKLTDWAKPARSVIIESAGALFGLGIVAAGLWIAVGQPSIRKGLATL